MADKLTRVDTLIPHPERALVPDLSQEEYEALRDDIKANGIMQPLLCHGSMVIDGHHRLRVAKELGLPVVPVIHLVGMSADDEVERLVALNGNRRQWTREQKRETAKRLAERGWSLRRIGGALGVTHGTVQNWFAGQVDKSIHLNPGATVVGLDGKHYPARKAPKEEPANGNGRQYANARIRLPEGKTPEQVVREYAPLRADGMSIQDVCDDSGVHHDTFALMEQVVAVADRADLTPADRATADEALREMNETRQVRHVVERIRPIISRIYGDSKAPGLERREALRTEAFDRAFGALVRACELAPEIEIPYLGVERCAEVLSELESAIKSVRALITKIKEAR